MGIICLALVYWGFNLAAISGWGFFVAGLFGIVMTAGGILEGAGMKNKKRQRNIVMRPCKKGVRSHFV